MSTDEVKDILYYAKTNNIDTLDTASGYGNSEQVLGEVGIDNYRITTKTSSLKNGVDSVIKEFYKSMENLNQKAVDGLLIHDINEVNDKEFNDLFKQLNELKQKRLVNKVGFSTYMPEQVDFLLENFDFDLIQLPFNVFDNRLIQGGQLNTLKDNGVEVHARSIFLQGVLLDFDSLPSYFSTWQKQFNEYQTIVKESGLSLLEYSLNYALKVQEIDKILVGVNSKKQLEDIVWSIKNKGELDAYSIDDIDLLNPSLWKTQR